MAPIVVALLAGACFAASTLLPPVVATHPRRRSLAIAVAAGVLLGLAFGDLFPEALERSGERASAVFLGGFGAMYLVETVTRGHTHHAPGEAVHSHALTPFVVGLGVHNLADGFALGAAAELSTSAAIALGLGVLVHQVPVGLSLASVCAAGRVPPRKRVRIAILLGLAIPLAASATTLLPLPDSAAIGLLLAAAGGVLAYVGASHLLPEAQAEHPSRVTGLVFAATLALMWWLLRAAG